MEKPVLIRRAKLSDIPKIAKLWLQLMDYHTGIDPGLYRFKRNRISLYKKFLRRRIKESKSAVFVAQFKNKLIGNLIVTTGKLPPVYKIDKEGYVDEIFVEEKFRGKRIGLKLLDAAEEWAKKKKLYHLSLSVDTRNKKAINVYEHFGLKAHHLKMSKVISAD